jgi:DNA polymerase elongation subunit (family B)
MEGLDVSQLVHSKYDRLVAAEPGEDGRAVLFRRGEDGRLETLECDFHPWLLVAGEEIARTLRGASGIVPLGGGGTHRVRVSFPNLAAYEDGVKQLKALTGINPSSPLAPYRLFSDMTQQLLTALPARLFRSMAFADLRRMQLDIETRTAGNHHFPDARRPDDAVIMIGLRDSTGWEQALVLDETGEAALLKKMVDLVQERDPDVIEGHNIFNFDLDYLEKRCRRHRVRLALGRGRQAVRARASRFTAAERTATYRRYDIYGRHVIDTYHLVQLYDVSNRDLDSYGLKATAIHFGVAAPERTYVDGNQISTVFEQNPERLQEYCLDDVRETDGLARILSPSYFYQAQLVPYSYQNCVLRGNATRIDAMLCAEYLQAGESLPIPEAAAPLQGALTEAALPGVFHNVWHVDVRSLYPSIILANRLTPSNDRLGVFVRLLDDLRRFRLAAKDAMRVAGPAQRENLSALQGSFKILINSFYGYTAFAQGTFNDFGMAAEITGRGRDILASMRDFLLQSGAAIVEMDTDGIYFTPPDGVTDMDAMRQRVQAILPEGIEIELDASYQAMFCYKSKNYALLDWEGRISLTGAALKSRGLEPFQRRYMREHIGLLLTGREADADALYERYVADLETHRLPLKDFAKREILSTSPAAYADKLRAGETKRSAAYDLVLQSKREYSQGDVVEFYVTGNRKNVSVTGNSRLLEEADPAVRDENVPYYLDKLQQLRKKFTL